MAGQVEERVNPKSLEVEHVHKVYSEIAKHFSETRYKPWPEIAAFINALPPGSLLADVGCGNGKYLSMNPHVLKIGLDSCGELVQIAAHRGFEVVTADCMALPLRSSCYDAVICIAVIHHLSTEERRVEALKELVRVLCVGGRLLVYVWAFEQQRKKFAGQDVMVPWHLQSKFSSKKENKGMKSKDTSPQGAQCCKHRGACADEPDPQKTQDLKKQGYVTYQRYYHVFKEGELGQLFQHHLKGVEVEREYYDHENWCVLAVKKE